MATDYLVLRGAKGIFERAPPSVVVVETTANAPEITGSLSQHGYDCCEYDGVQSLSRLTHPVQNTYAIHASARGDGEEHANGSGAHRWTAAGDRADRSGPANR
jgi:hypothetical protein